MSVSTQTARPLGSDYDHITLSKYIYSPPLVLVFLGITWPRGSRLALTFRLRLAGIEDDEEEDDDVFLLEAAFSDTKDLKEKINN